MDTFLSEIYSALNHIRNNCVLITQNTPHMPCRFNEEQRQEQKERDIESFENVLNRWKARPGISNTNTALNAIDTLEYLYPDTGNIFWNGMCFLQDTEGRKTKSKERRESVYANLQTWQDVVDAAQTPQQTPEPSL